MVNSILKVEPLGFPWKTSDPFLFCAYHADKYPEGNGAFGPSSQLLKDRTVGNDFTIKDGWRMYHGATIPGFPVHPHRGFETITINKAGFVDHADSLGASGRFGVGDVQWMTAGKGVQHSEMFPLIFTEKENYLEIFQIWLNLPKEKKMVNAHFKMLWNEDIPKIKIEDEVGKHSLIDVIAGTFNHVKAPDPTPESWAADSNNHVVICTIKMEAGAYIVLPSAKEGLNRSLYFYKGDKICIDNTEVLANNRIELDSILETKIHNSNSECFLLLLQGKPINEPVVQYGPFVMNTQAEIQETYKDYQETYFGGWPWENSNPVHGGSENGRFAKYANGKTERK
jgi:redox-sensitive bicupin YhaK (pirin superfamily)